MTAEECTTPKQALAMFRELTEKETLEDTANKLGCSIAFVSMVKRGKKSPLRVSFEIQNKYGIPASAWQAKRRKKDAA